jgi:hypothetical protein
MSRRAPGTRTPSDLRWRARLREVRDTYRAGLYVAGSWHPEAVCKGCRKTFPVWREVAHVTYCSRPCSGKEDNLTPEQRRAKDRARRARRVRIKRAPTTRRCAYCDEPFNTTTTARYCSRGCVIHSTRERQRANYWADIAATHEKQRAYRRQQRKARTNVSCRRCGVPITSGRIHKQYCSEKCERLARARAQQRTARAELRDSWVRQELKDRPSLRHLKSSEIPQSLIDAYRAYLQVRRELHRRTNP